MRVPSLLLHLLILWVDSQRFFHFPTQPISVSFLRLSVYMTEIDKKGYKWLSISIAIIPSKRTNIVHMAITYLFFRHFVYGTCPIRSNVVAEKPRKSNIPRLVRIQKRNNVICKKQKIVFSYMTIWTCSWAPIVIGHVIFMIAMWWDMVGQKTTLPVILVRKNCFHSIKIGFSGPPYWDW